MSDVLMPLNLRHARTAVRYLDSSGISRGMFGGQTIVAARGGDRLALTLEMTKHGGRTTTGLAERAQLRSWLASLRGRQNAVYAQDKSRQRRGTFPTGELLANNTFSNGTTGWSIDATSSLSAADRVIRATYGQGGSENLLFPASAVTVTQYAPYVARAMVIAGRGSYTSLGIGIGSTNTGVQYANLASQTPGLLTVAGVPSGTSAYATVYDGAASGQLAGDYILIPYMSLSRCALVDNGSNLLQRSDEFGNGFWGTSQMTVSSDADIAPTAAMIADYLRETNTSSSHFISNASGITVPSGAADYSFSVAIQAGNRSWAYIYIAENTGSTTAIAWFNLSTGAIGTVTTGANFANARAAITALGNNWYRCSITARKTNAATSMSVAIGAATADNTTSFTGVTNQVALVVWRATFAASSAPARLVQSTSAAVTQQPQTGSALHLKGLPASTSGLLEIDDQVEVVTGIGSELKIVTARLNSDASGLGYLQFEPPLRTAPVDNAPIVVHQPFGRFLFSGDAVGFDNDPGVWTTASAEFEEA